MKPMSITYDVFFPGDKNAGLHAFGDTVTVTIASGDPGGEPDEFAEWMLQSLREWFDIAGVQIRKDETVTDQASDLHSKG